MITLTANIVLADGTKIPLNNRNLLSLDFEISDRADMILPSWGIISNGGNFSFIDYNGRIKDLASGLKLKSGTKINIYLNDTISGSMASIGEFFASKWNYDNDNSTVSVSITDGLQRMQDINIVPLEFNPITNGEGYNYAKQIYDFLQEQTEANGFRMVATSSSSFNSATLEHLNKCYIKYPYIKETNLWRAWQNFAEAFQLHIFKNMNGQIVCYYRGGD